MVGDEAFIAHELFALKGSNDQSGKAPHFNTDSKRLADLRTSLTSQERHNCIDALLTMVLQMLLVRSTTYDIASLVHLLSKYLEYEWEEASRELSDGVRVEQRSNKRRERYLFSRKCSTVFLFLLVQTASSSRELVSNFAAACGSVQGGAAWILSSLVNSHCDYIRGIGVRSLVAYVQATSGSPDTPLSLGKSSAAALANITGEARKQGNTISLITNVGHGLLNSNVGKGLSSIGHSERSKALSLAKLTPRVAFKLLWHLLKSHRFRLGVYTQGALVSMVFERKETDRLLNHNSIADICIRADDTPEHYSGLDFERAEARMADGSVDRDATLRDGLGVSTIMRLLRFLPHEYAEQWLSDLVGLSKKNTSGASISLSSDWQPCLFQFISEIVEKIVNQAAKGVIDSGRDEKHFGEVVERHLQNQFRLSLELYGILLGNLVRGGSEMVSSVAFSFLSLRFEYARHF
jgi:hypothetical protein